MKKTFVNNDLAQKHSCGFQVTANTIEIQRNLSFNSQHISGTLKNKNCSAPSSK